MSKIKNCPVCKNEIADSTKVCPSCGAKQKKPIWKKWWVWAIVVVVIVAVATGGNDNESTNVGGEVNNDTIKTEVEEAIVYEEYDVDEMVDALESNAMAAEEKYSEKYITLTGRLSTIDSDGKYISLDPVNTQFSIIGVQCYLKNDDQKSKVMTLSKGDIVKVNVKIKSIGEVIGYTADIIEFVE